MYIKVAILTPSCQCCSHCFCLVKEPPTPDVTGQKNDDNSDTGEEDEEHETVGDEGQTDEEVS